MSEKIDEKMNEKSEEIYYKLPTDNSLEILELSKINPVGTEVKMVLRDLAISSAGNHLLLDVKFEGEDARIILRRKTDEKTGFKPNCNGIMYAIMQTIISDKKAKKSLGDAEYILDSDLIENFHDNFFGDVVILTLNHVEIDGDKSRRKWSIE